MQKKADIEKLKKAGVLSAKATKALEKSGGVSKRNVAPKRFLKTADGVWVIPTLYFRGGKNTKPSKKQTELTNKINTLITKYTTERKTA
tara:strand:+ start:189 stop:455 length:267 start_codon:yes stop_codon:yes gene_type:complete